MTGPISIEVDLNADAAYIYLSDKRAIAETAAVSSTVNVDLDQFGVAVGIEVLGLRTEIPWAKLVRDCHVHSSVEATVRLIAPSVQGFMVRVQNQAAGAQDFSRKTDAQPVPA